MTYFSSNVKIVLQRDIREGDIMSRNDDFSFEIKEHLGILGEYPTGWKKELNLV